MTALEQYKTWLTARQYSPATIYVYCKRITRFLKIHPDPFIVAQGDIEFYLTELLAGVLNQATLEGHFSALKNFYTFLSIRDPQVHMLGENPLKNLLPVKREKRVPKIIPNDDLSRLLRAPDLKTVRGCRDYVIMLFLLHGLRAAELCGMDADKVFMDGWGPARRMLIDVKGKGRKERRIVMENSGDTEWAWNRYQKKRNGDGSAIAFPAIMSNGRVKRMTTNGLYRMLHRYGRKLKISRVHPHVWRHTAAVSMLDEGVPLKEIQYRLGHESVQTTERYLGAAKILQEEAANSRFISRLQKANSRFRRWRR